MFNASRVCSQTSVTVEHESASPSDSWLSDWWLKWATSEEINKGLGILKNKTETSVNGLSIPPTKSFADRWSCAQPDHSVCPCCVGTRGLCLWLEKRMQPSLGWNYSVGVHMWIIWIILLRYLTEFNVVYIWRYFIELHKDLLFNFFIQDGTTLLRLFHTDILPWADINFHVTFLEKHLWQQFRRDMKETIIRRWLDSSFPLIICTFTLGVVGETLIAFSASHSLSHLSERTPLLY